MYKFIVALVTLALFVSCSDKKAAKDELVLKGYVKGLKKGKLYLQRVQDSTIVVLDTIVLNGDSHFESNVKLEAPEMLYLYLDRGVTESKDNNLLFFAEPGNMTVDTNLEFFLGNAKFTGSKNQELYEQYKHIISQFNDEQLKLLQAQIMGTKGNKNYSAEENTKKQEQLLKRRYLYAANFALTNANHEVAPYIALTDIYDMQPRFLDSIHRKMTPEITNSKYGKKFTEFLKKQKEVN
jgi:hypothetical protein